MIRIKELKKSDNRLAGFTLLELLISAFLAVIVTSAAMGIYITQHKQMLVQDEISDMQANIRAAAVELATNIRMCGYNVPFNIPKLEAYNTNPDTIVITFDAGNLENVVLEWPMPQVSAELRCDHHDLSGIYDGDWIYIYDPLENTGEWFEITHVQYGSSHIQHNTMALDHEYPTGSLVLKMNRFKYYVDNTDPEHPNLMIEAPGMGAQVYAENITDLNFRYVLSSGAVVDVPPDEEMVREIIINIGARTNSGDDEFAADYRTRDLETRVKVRNLGLN
ncbi:MAG: prepilin-type N-terminal cleavage/methylation domain-containing protein [candidate division Zixibacteria bacterium]